MPDNQAIIFFDGVCNLCNGFVQFVIRYDKGGYFRFASLQSEEARPYLTGNGIDPSELGTVVLYENGKCYTRSTAALRIFRRLSGAWSLLFAGIIIPSFLRDVVYNFVAHNRYRWFGQKESCMLPTPELRSRFL
ncbi:thiol-disulfide oxidoreductase DCC family protein [Adhaeribacter soli]|uniref:Thiol-disulfide oxidoreductase DCC family protein n=1 Tax=Adhaeribacter soli TaxID=2607655 RepID=A0A5N1J6X5_9BACT|nr:thiol-disulfide oxidoreductase DCC family protein [Adhaeribacter soli]KAA9345873.1 thiol-disulfide oxidoreductase DCC family protein [Adhaeribacter soli]